MRKWFIKWNEHRPLRKKLHIKNINSMFEYSYAWTEVLFSERKSVSKYYDFR